MNVKNKSGKSLQKNEGVKSRKLGLVGATLLASGLMLSPVAAEAKTQKVPACSSATRDSSGFLYSRVIRQITSNSGSLKNELGVSADESVDVTVKVKVDKGGKPKVQSVTAKTSTKSVDVTKIANVNVEGILVSAPEKACNLSIPVRLR